MKTETFWVGKYGNEKSGAYAQVFKRGNLILADLNFFDGDRTAHEIKAFIATLTAVVEKMEEENEQG